MKMVTKEGWEELVLNFLSKRKGEKFLVSQIFGNWESRPITHAPQELEKAVEELKRKGKVETGKDEEGNEWLRYKEKR